MLNTSPATRNADTSNAISIAVARKAMDVQENQARAIQQMISASGNVDAASPSAVQAAPQTLETGRLVNTVA